MTLLYDRAGVGWQTANVGTQRVVIEHAVRADTITRVTAIVDYNPGGGDFQQAIVYVSDYRTTSKRLKIGDTAIDLRFTPPQT